LLEAAENHRSQAPSLPSVPQPSGQPSSSSTLLAAPIPASVKTACGRNVFCGMFHRRSLGCHCSDNSIFATRPKDSELLSGIHCRETSSRRVAMTNRFFCMRFLNVAQNLLTSSAEPSFLVTVLSKAARSSSPASSKLAKMSRASFGRASITFMILFVRYAHVGSFGLTGPWTVSIIRFVLKLCSRFSPIRHSIRLRHYPHFLARCGIPVNPTVSALRWSFIDKSTVVQFFNESILAPIRLRSGGAGWYYLRLSEAKVRPANQRSLPDSFPDYPEWETQNLIVGPTVIRRLLCAPLLK
jgi:hypothetical protein